MKAAVLTAEPAAWARARVTDYLALTKPRIAVLVLLTVAVGVLLAAGPALTAGVLVHALVGTALVAAGASALNQWLERDSDALMHRTEGRPLPAGRLQPVEVLLFGGLLGVVGVGYLACTLRQPAAAVVAAVTFALYVGAYTPLKSRTPLNTLVGAVPGALPPVIGWVAVRGEASAEAVALFAIVFLWQVPHFLAIAWVYRDEYARAGLVMLPVLDPAGRRTARQMATYCLALLPASLMPVLLGAAGPVYFAGAAPMGLGFLATALAFGRNVSDRSARRVLRASLGYLPGLLGLLVLDAALAGRLG
jgi:protoheme IX farnesyltransferase